MKAPCYNCNNRREVTMAEDGKLYCEQCHPDRLLNGFDGGDDKASLDDLKKLFGMK